MKKYRLLKNLPYLGAGAIFEHRDYDEKFPDRGNPGFGCMILSWLDGQGQGAWAGETYIFPGQLVDNKEWFEPVDATVIDLVGVVEDLKTRISYLEKILK